MTDYCDTGDYFIESYSGIYVMPSMHYHPSYELYYLEAGRREYFVGDKFFSVPAGSFVLISPYKLHRTGGAYAKRTLISFTGDFLEKTYTPAVAEEILKCFDKLLITPPEEEQERFKTLINSMKDCKDDTAFSLNLGILLKALCGCDPEENYDEYISGIIKYINESFAEIHSIDQIAGRFYISKYHLCRIFKSAMKITVIDYLNNIRIKNACRYISSTDKELAEIAQLCGFNSSAYFSKVFKDITGLSPREYKKK